MQHNGSVFVRRLQQHFRDGSGNPEVAVDLERRVRVQQIGVNRLLEHGLNARPCRFPVAQPRKQARQPCVAPPGVPAAVRDAVRQRFARRVKQRRPLRNRPRRIQPVQVGHMAVSRLRFGEFVCPFQQPTVRPDAQRRQFVR